MCVEGDDIFYFIPCFIPLNKDEQLHKNCDVLIFNFYFYNIQVEEHFRHDLMRFVS